MLRLPAAERVPAAVPPAAVTVNGVHAAGIEVVRRTLTISLPRRRPGVTCDSIVVSPVTVAVARSAGLGNPKAPGTYAISVTDGREAATARLTIR